MEKQLIPVVRKVYDVENSTKAALTLLIQMTLLFSGLIRQDFSTRISLNTGKSLTIDLCRKHFTAKVDNFFIVDN